jgi:type II secretory pathway pseudopilin PulG
MNKTTFSAKGFTLIEITLVLGLTLGLAAALIFGLAAFNNGADRAKCLLNIANVQKAVRSLQNLNEMRPGDTSPRRLNAANLWGGKEAFLSSRPICPRAGGTNRDAADDSARGNTTYSASLTAANSGYSYHRGGEHQFPELGTAYINCVSPGVSDAYLHVPREVDGQKTNFAGTGMN